jgi:hypothetical protein
MDKIAKGLCWAGALLLLAAGNYFGLVDDKTAGTLFIVLPVVAVVSLGSGCGCGLWRRTGQA